VKIDLDTVLKKTNRYYAQEKGRDTEDCKPVPSEQIRALAKALVEELNVRLLSLEVFSNKISDYLDAVK
jgi:hypothetical protein